jgi:hypothetical protein
VSTPPGQSQQQPTEQQLREAYEAELSRITSADMMLQAAVSLLNVGGRRLGLAAGAENERDLDQVRDAIDGVRALLPILERNAPEELRPLREALSQLQLAYTREAQTAEKDPQNTEKKPQDDKIKDSETQQTPPAEQESPPADSNEQPAPGPAQASGRLWVPGR